MVTLLFLFTSCYRAPGGKQDLMILNAIVLNDLLPNELKLLLCAPKQATSLPLLNLNSLTYHYDI